MEKAMNLSDLKPAAGSTKNRKRIGRGQGSGWGCTSGRGNKGAGQRSGRVSIRGFEGGQMPLQRRLPKRGFDNSKFQTPVSAINLERLEKIASDTIDPQVLFDHGLIGNPKRRVKILGVGEVKRPLQLKVHSISASARQKVEGAGGKVEVI
jgi:large subunit ribosomal protein L15